MSNPNLDPTDRQDSTHALSFSKQIYIRRIKGPFRSYDWRKTPWQVSVFVTTRKDDTGRMWFHVYHQKYESAIHALIRSLYYRVYKLYHNVKYRSYNR